jgi:hypothetical protein
MKEVCDNSLLTMTVATLQQLKCLKPTIKCFRRVPYNDQAFCGIPRMQHIACVIEQEYEHSVLIRGDLMLFS